MLVMGQYRLLLLGICQKLRILWHFEIFANTGPYGAGDFKMLPLLQFSSVISLKLYEDTGYHAGIYM